MSMALPHNLIEQPQGVARRWRLVILMDVLAAALLAWYLLPAARQVGRSWFFAAAFGAWLVLSFLVDSRWILRKRTGILVLGFLALWYCVYAANFLFGRSSMFYEYAYVMATFFAPALLYWFYYSTGQTKKLEYFAWLILALFLVSAATTLVGQVLHPNSARIISTGIARLGVDKLSRANIGGYGFSYALMLFSILFAGYIRRQPRGRAKVWLYITLGAVLLTLYATQFTICLMLAVTGVAATLWLTKKRAAVLAVVSAAFLLLMFLFSEQISHWLNHIADLVFPQTIASRVKDVVRLLSRDGLTGDLSARVENYTISLRTARYSPLFGMGGYYGYNSYAYGIGGHSELFDVIARYGVVGAVPLIGLFGTFFVHVRKMYGGNPMRGCILAMHCVFLVLACINVIFNGTEMGVCMFLLAPAMGYMRDVSSWNRRQESSDEGGSN